ncbi:hypothetical protein Q3G72_012596 [Acer saccharum]|nr:hypothetical protein Q3G72_012596 [Acer saccharum]
MNISESRVSYWKQINIHNRTAQPNMMRPRVTTADGYTYLVELEIGDPLKTVYLIMDTGSSVTWMQCLPCQECFPQKFDIYDPKNSKTFKKIPCNSPICQSFKCVDQQCLYSIGYMDGDSRPKGMLPRKLSTSRTNKVDILILKMFFLVARLKAI